MSMDEWTNILISVYHLLHHVTILLISSVCRELIKWSEKGLDFFVGTTNFSFKNGLCMVNLT